VLRNGGKLFYSFQAWKLAEVLLKAGRADECDRLITQALDVVMEHQDRAYLAELIDVQGRAKAAQGDLEGAEEGLRSAMSTAMALGSVPARLESANHLAQLLSDTGRVTPAADVLTRATRLIEPDAPFPGFHRAISRLNELRP
jgi:ATP/maltotriose-dependent transcriptional regulator MalT